ncbi:hypothetical protein EUGRSUZ_E03909 [Eucalyptus grandis]|uniref:Aminomethyltransferase n=2 Tax=Eucalyptus grandis TaxID=71139 RepID=A0A059CB35_EUCGR|nr:hypothetical protein EUGRSUZ_E03909 [Eucalyptus grandis]
MVPFAGWSMPIQYKDSIMESTVNCRENGSLFDVSHMCGLSLKGKDCIPFLEKLVIADVAALAPGTGTLSVFTNEKGGAIDDSVITKVKDDHIYLVVNAGCRDKDLAHIEEHMKAFKAKGGDVLWHIHDERSLLALQGPLAAPVLQHLTKEDLSKIYFSDFRIIDINGSSCFLTRTGYTGEDGFEISVPSEHAVDLAKAILEKSEGKVRLTGLGARDSLRLEAGLHLYGNDMEQHITLVEAGLTWASLFLRASRGRTWSVSLPSASAGCFHHPPPDADAADAPPPPSRDVRSALTLPLREVVPLFQRNDELDGAGDGDEAEARALGVLDIIPRKQTQKCPVFFSVSPPSPSFPPQFHFKSFKHLSPLKTTLKRPLFSTTTCSSLHVDPLESDPPLPSYVRTFWKWLAEEGVVSSTCPVHPAYVPEGLWLVAR